MAISGKYDFRGIKRLGASALRGAFMSSPYTLWVTRLGSFSDLILEFIANWLANKGLIILNLGAIYVSGEIDQKQFDAHLDVALDQIKQRGGRDKLSPEQIKEIDDEVIKAARKFVLIGNDTNKPIPDYSGGA